MRSLSGSSITTFLMFVPLLAVPLLAIFGIPEFSPVNASPSGDENRVLQVSDRDAAGGQSQKHSPDDLFAAVEKRAEFAADFKRLGVERRDDPFRSNSNGDDVSPSHDSDALSANRSRLGGWKIDAKRHNPSSGNKFGEMELKGAANGMTANRDDRNPFAPDSNRTSQPPAPPRKRLESFSDYEKSRRRNDVRTGGSPPARTSPGSSAEPRTRSFDKKMALRNGANGQNGPLTWRSAVARLNKLGIRDFRLQPGRKQNEFHFSCTFTPHHGTRVMHRFEAEDTEPLKAVEQVLAQIESWLRRR